MSEYHTFLGEVRPLMRPPQSKWRARLLAAGLIALASASIVPRTSMARTWIDEYVDVATHADAACRAKELEACRSGLVRLGELTDGRPDFKCRLVRIDAALGSSARALDDLAQCIHSGLAFKGLSTDPTLKAVRRARGYKAVKREARRRALPVKGYAPHLALKDRNLIAEDVAYDPSEQAFYVSSVRERKILRLGSDGTVEDFTTAASTPLWGVYALAVDPAHGVLWATTIASAESPPFESKDDGASAVLKFDLRTRALLARYELSDGRHHGFGDVALAADGDLLVSDGIDGELYWIAARDGTELRTVVGVGSFRSPQTPALVPGTSRLLVPDYSRGIAVVDMRDGAVSWLPDPPELALFGIDGLYIDGRALIAVQNGTVPERILVMTLDSTCTRITDWHAAVVNVAGLGDPTHGVFVGRKFYFIANSGWDRVKEDGSLGEEETAKPAELWRLRFPPAAGAQRGSCKASGS